ncbi:MAG: 6-bladed beta-propeller [Gemmatimonadota bacterium]
MNSKSGIGGHGPALRARSPLLPRQALAVAVALLSARVPPPASAASQQAVELDRSASCETCSVVLEKLLTIGDSHGRGAFHTPPDPPTRDSRGRYYVVSRLTRGETAAVFDSYGRFLTRIGAVGEGPGEYRNPVHDLIGPSDTVYMLDRGNARATVLSPEHELVRTFSIPPSVWDAALVSNDLYLNAQYFGADLIGKPLHQYSPDGRRLRSFDEHLVRLDDISRYTRQLAPSTKGVWSALHTHEYELTLWDHSGAPQQRLRSTSGWFASDEHLTSPSPSVPPSSLIRNLYEDEEGRLWVFGQVAADSWSEGLGERRDAEGTEFYPVESEHSLYDGVIDVIDPAAGRIVVSAKIPFVVAGVVSPGVVASVRQDELGWFYLDLYSVTLMTRTDG